MSEIKFTAENSQEANNKRDLEKRKKATAAAEEKAQEALKAARKAQSEAKDELNRIRKEAQLEQSIRVWKEITAIKERAEQEILDLIEYEKAHTVTGQGGLKGITASKFKGEFSRHYLYQHLGNGKGQTKGNDENADWVKTYLKENPDKSLADLITKAENTIAKSFSASFIRKNSKGTKGDNKGDKKSKKEPVVDVNKRAQ